MLYKRDFYTLFFFKEGDIPLPHPPPARSLRSLAEDLRQMCPLRGFAPPKLKVFRRACCCHIQNVATLWWESMEIESMQYNNTGWPRRNATTLIVIFKNIVDETELFLILFGRTFIFQQNDTMIIESNVTVFIPNGWIRYRREGAARAIFYIKRTPDGRRPVLYISPGTFEGPWGGRRIAVRHPWAPQGARPCFLHENWQKNHAEPDRPSAGARTGPLGCHHGPSTGFLRPNGQMKRPGESGAASSAPRRPYGWWKMSRCPWEPWGSRPGTVRNWPKCLFLLAVRAPEWICDLGFSTCYIHIQAALMICSVTINRRKIIIFGLSIHQHHGKSGTPNNN